MFIVHVGLVKTRSPNLSVYSKGYLEFSRKIEFYTPEYYKLMFRAGFLHGILSQLGVILLAAGRGSFLLFSERCGTVI